MRPDEAKKLAAMARKQAAMSDTRETRQALLEIAERYEKIAKDNRAD